MTPLLWWPDVGIRELPSGGRVTMAYINLHCSRETSNDQASAADEPYVIFAVITPDETVALLSTTYGDVDAGDDRPERMVLYEGRPAGLAISTVLREWDSGSSEQARKTVEDAIDNIVGAAKRSADRSAMLLTSPTTHLVRRHSCSHRGSWSWEPRTPCRWMAIYPGLLRSAP